MVPRRIVSFVGFVLVIVGIYCPLISPLGLINWNLLDLNKTFALILNSAAFCGMPFIYKKRNREIKFFAYLTLGLVTLVFIAVILKVQTAFSFIPFPKIANTLSGFIHYRWGWYLLFAGSVLALSGSVGSRKSLHTNVK